jgi:hypothetical protein
MSSPQQYISRLFIAAILISISFSAQSAMIRVSQESAPNAGDYDNHVLGYIDTFVTSLSIADFYGYNNSGAPSYNGTDPATVSSMTQGFFVEASDGLHYVVVNDARLDGSGGRSRMVTLLAGGAGGTSAFSVHDDPSPSDSYATTDLVTGGRRFETHQFWSDCCTDGYAIGDLGSSFIMLAAFLAVPEGITSWQATGNSRADIALELDPRRAVLFDLAPVPIPAAVWLFGTALIGLVGFGKRKSRIAA